MSEETDAAASPLTPLTPVAFDVLLSLLAGPAHGYAIMRAVEERTPGEGGLHPGTLYRALSRLVASGLIEEVGAPAAADNDERRRYYSLTPDGRRAAAVEARRLEARLGEARAHGLLGRA